MDSLIGLIMLLFCVWNGFQGYSVEGFDYNARWYAQTIISGVGGLYIMFPKIKHIFNSFVNGNNEDNPEMDDSHKSNPDLQRCIEQKDFECLSYIRDRCIEEGLKEGVELSVQLNTLLFKRDIMDKSPSNPEA